MINISYESKTSCSGRSYNLFLLDFFWEERYIRTLEEKLSRYVCMYICT